MLLSNWLRRMRRFANRIFQVGKTGLPGHLPDGSRMARTTPPRLAGWWTGSQSDRGARLLADSGYEPALHRGKRGGGGAGYLRFLRPFFGGGGGGGLTELAISCHSVR